MHRAAEDITQEELAKRVGTKQTTVSLWESGKQIPSLENLCAVADALKVGITELVQR
jgi:transcriptional regulator with XRE-family HTH domain